MVAAYLRNIDLQAIGDDLLVIDMRMRPEAIAEALKAAEGPFALIIGDTLQALFDGDDLNHNVQAGEFMRRWRPQHNLTRIGARAGWRMWPKRLIFM